MEITRRRFGRVALAGVPALAIWRGMPDIAAQSVQPLSRWAGVQVGLNVPYSLGTGNNISAEDLLERVVALGVGGLELRAQPVEHFLGSPSIRAAAAAAAARGTGEGRGRGGAAAGAARGARGGQRGGAPADANAAMNQAAEVRAWRLSAPTERLADLRRTYESAGVLIEILKVDGLYSIASEELDYFFQMAKALGARAISAELPDDAADTRRIGAFADKHQVFMAYHHHAQAGPADYERVFSEAKFNAANIDIGHWTATHNSSPLPFIRTHHARISHIHVKDRRFGTNGGANVPFGQGDTEIREILQAIRDNKWNIQATIEFEYPVPEGSDRVTEIRRSIEFCRDVLLG